MPASEQDYGAAMADLRRSTTDTAASAALAVVAEHCAALREEVERLRQVITTRDPLERLIDRTLDPRWDRVLELAEAGIQAEQALAAAEGRRADAEQALAAAQRDRTELIRSILPRLTPAVVLLATGLVVWILRLLGVDPAALVGAV